MSNLVRLVTHSRVVIPTLGASPYAVGDVVGAVQVLEDLPVTGPQHASLINLQIIDKTPNKTPFDVFFFSAAPSLADGAACNISVTDILNCVGNTAVIDCDYGDGVSTAFANVVCQVPLLPGEQSLYVALKANHESGTVAYAAGDLIIKYYFALDYA